MTTVQILDALKTYIKTYTGLSANAPVSVDYLGEEPAEYAVIPLPGARKAEQYINGSSLREFPFALEFTGSTADEVARLANNGELETFADWLDSQTEAGTFPTLNSNQTPEKIEATGWGYLLQQGESQTAVYQIQAKLTYTQSA